MTVWQIVGLAGFSLGVVGLVVSFTHRDERLARGLQDLSTALVDLLRRESKHIDVTQELQMRSRVQAGRISELRARVVRLENRLAAEQDARVEEHRREMLRRQRARRGRPRV